MQQQISFSELGEPLHEVTFAVLDIETTGGSPQQDAITEIGVVKVRGGEVIGEFQTLVNPGTSIPIQIEVLTGITTSMVVTAPKITEVLPSFFEFMQGAIPVAHNASFDISFLRAAAIRHGYQWNLPKALDTVRLAKIALGSEVRNRKLATLAQRFGTKVQPNHRALSDARATVEIFHHLLERLGRMGIHELTDLQEITPKLPAQIRSKATLADSLTSAPGCYIFKDAQETVLYVGVSQNIKQRVRTYFTRSENRRHVKDVLAITNSISAIECATTMEARVRELRLIAQYRPAANRVARNPEKIWWIYFNAEDIPRLIVSKNPPSLNQAGLGPFRKKFIAEELRDLINDQFQLRSCIDRLKNRPNHPGCIRGEMNHCLMPCQMTADDFYLDLVNQINEYFESKPDVLIDILDAKMHNYAALERFEVAQKYKELIDTFSIGVNRIAKLKQLVTIPEFISTQRTNFGIEIHIIKYGRLVAAGVATNEYDVAQTRLALLNSAEQVEPRGLLPAKSAAGFDDAPAAIGEAELLMQLSDLAELTKSRTKILPLL